MRAIAGWGLLGAAVFALMQEWDWALGSLALALVLIIGIGLRDRLGRRGRR